MPVGTGTPRVDGRDKVTGAARYPQDLPAAGCLHAATVRAPIVHALLRGIDAAPALALPGVRRVLTHRDVRGTNRFGLLVRDQPVLAEDRVRGVSDVIALVVADTEEAAREAARRVRLTLDPLPLLLDPARACDPDAPVIHPDRPAGSAHPNLVAEARVGRGDPLDALARAPIVIEGRYETGWVEHAFLGPEAGLATRDDQGRLVLWTATQWPDEDLRQASEALGEPRDRLRLVQTAIGGAFGGREDISLQILLFLAARESGAPVRMVWDREESILGHGKRHPFRMHFRVGAGMDGRLLAVHAELLADAGCYASVSAAVLDNAVAQATGPYAVPHLSCAGRAVYTNNPYTCAFRGFGVNQVCFAMEQQMNKLAHRLGLDPLALRRRNLAGSGDLLGGGQALVGLEGLGEALEQACARASAAPLPPDEGPHRHGRGVAVALKNVGYSFGYDDHATAEVTLERDRAEVRIGATDVGQGAQTVLAQIAAQVLDLPPDRVLLRWQDTALVPEAGSASASHQTYISGNAVKHACHEARRAAEVMGGRDSLPPGGVTVRHTYHAPSTVPLSAPAPAFYIYAFTGCACVADVRVDTETGRVTVLRVIEAVDVGRAINPQLLTAQVEGGVVMGQGYALQERFSVKDGRPVTPGLEGCLLPTAVDAAPQIETILVERPDPEGPFGARGVGEVVMLPVVPALTAAIHAATATWVDTLPATPERVWRSLSAEVAR